jgi:hypothetical protein
MVEIKNALRDAQGKTSLDGIKIEAALKATLERLMPIYQRRWWPEHDCANQRWVVAVQRLLERHGAALRQAIFACTTARGRPSRFPSTYQ